MEYTIRALLNNIIPMSKNIMKNRFRGFLPVIVDVETGGFDCKKNALLEVAAVFVQFDENEKLNTSHSIHDHIEPFQGSLLDPKALEITGIKPHNPFRFAKTEQEGLERLFEEVSQQVKQHNCQRAVLVGHNPGFDLGFIQAAMKRCNIKKSPFHLFTTFDTATLGALAYGQTVLARAVKKAGIDFDADQAHSALYDAEKTAELFCRIVNRWSAIPPTV